MSELAPARLLIIQTLPFALQSHIQHIHGSRRIDRGLDEWGSGAGLRPGRFGLLYIEKAENASN